MDYFFYGTLMDQDVLGAVLGRRIAPARLKPAVLVGYRCVYAKGVTYPALVPGAAGDAVTGCVMVGVTPPEAARLRRFEGADYREAPLTVTAEGRGERSAVVFLPRSRMVTTDRPWDLDAWRRRHKRDYLGRVRGWMGMAPSA